MYPECNLPTVNDMETLVHSTRKLPEAPEGIQKYLASTKLFIDAFPSVIERGKPFRTNDNLLGLCPNTTVEGDSVWIIHGAKVPYILRSVPDSDSFELVGEAYLHGFMQGEIHELGMTDFYERSPLCNEVAHRARRLYVYLVLLAHR